MVLCTGLAVPLPGGMHVKEPHNTLFVVIPQHPSQPRAVCCMWMMLVLVVRVSGGRQTAEVCWCTATACTPVGVCTSKAYVVPTAHASSDNVAV